MSAYSLSAEPQGKPKNTGVDSLSLLQRIFPTQELNRGLLHCRQLLYQLSYETWQWNQGCNLNSTPCCIRRLKPQHQFSSVQLLSRIRLFVIPWTAACQTSLSITNSQSLLKLMPIESVMPYNHLILCRPLLLLPSIFPSIRVFSNESALRIRWPKYWCLSFSSSLSNEHSGLISFRIDLFDFLAVQGTLKESSPTPQFKSINCSVLNFLYSPTLTSIHVDDHRKNHTWPQEKP